jgi:hypothetical protein
VALHDGYREDTLLVPLLHRLLTAGADLEAKNHAGLTPLGLLLLTVGPRGAAKERRGLVPPARGKAWPAQSRGLGMARGEAQQCVRGRRWSAAAAANRERSCCCCCAVVEALLACHVFHG